MKRILAAVDQSSNADAVVARAAELALALDGRVRLVHVVPDAPKAPPPVFDAQRFDRTLPENVRDGVVVTHGDIVENVLAIAQQYCADIVVIGAHSYRWAERVLGTKAAELVNRIDRPVLVVRPSSPERSAIFPLVTELRAQHARLDAVYSALLDAYREGEWCDVHDEWDVFEPLLRAHMAHEEITWIPLFHEVERKETDAILAEHGALRSLLDAVGLGIELHSATLPEAEELVTILRAHAAREERIFYPWIAAREERTRGAVGTARAS